MLKIKPEVILLLGASLWGLGWIPLAYLANQGLAGMSVVLYTYGLLCVLAIPVLLLQRRAWWPQRRSLLLICFCGGWATAGLVSALSEGDVVRAMLLFYLAPVWGLLGGWLLLGERQTPVRITALVLAMSGIALTLGVSRETFSTLSGSDWLALSAGLAFACNNLATRAADQVPLASKSVVAFIGTALLSGVYCLLMDITPPTVGPGVWGLIALFGLFWLVAMSAAQFGFSHVEASRAAVLVVVELLVAVLTAAWLGEREIGVREWVGGALVLIAALLAEYRETPSNSLFCEAKK
jgi:drug/metabolite transporter (DMT)-like permease